VQLDLEHAEGVSLTIQVPYSYVGLRRKFTAGAMTVSIGVLTIWVEA
jgi:hypothetical protein